MTPVKVLIKQNRRFKDYWRFHGFNPAWKDIKYGFENQGNPGKNQKIREILL